ncbi:MAG TPA: deoxyribose-phosphate aldolase, partial [Cytophagales bacterium]|nr:deoxyribose-phosphate aldolase [Cytophagales bacterium]
MELARYIEHTNLSPAITIADVDRLVAEAKQFAFLGVCVPPFWVKRAKREIGSENILLVTVAGFPLGYSMTETKLDEINRAIDNGADEVDVVWNLSSFKTNLPWTKIEIAKCSKLAHDRQKLLKVIIETSFLSDEEIVSECALCVDERADFVKTYSGFCGGAPHEHH